MFVRARPARRSGATASASRVVAPAGRPRPLWTVFSWSRPRSWSCWRGRVVASAWEPLASLPKASSARARSRPRSAWPACWRRWGSSAPPCDSARSRDRDGPRLPEAGGVRAPLLRARVRRRSRRFATNGSRTCSPSGSTPGSAPLVRPFGSATRSGRPGRRAPARRRPDVVVLDRRVVGLDRRRGRVRGRGRHRLVGRRRGRAVGGRVGAVFVLQPRRRRRRRQLGRRGRRRLVRRTWAGRSGARCSPRPAPAAQARTIHWKSLAVTARLDADGVLHVRERHHVVMTGDWNGGSRDFRLEPTQQIQLERVVRIDPATGAAREIPKVSLDDIDQPGRLDAWAEPTCCAGGRLPADPPLRPDRARATSWSTRLRRRWSRTDRADCWLTTSRSRSARATSCRTCWTSTSFQPEGDFGRPARPRRARPPASGRGQRRPGGAQVRGRR